MHKGAIADLVVFIVCVGTFLAYHGWMYFIRPSYPAHHFHHQRVFNVYRLNFRARGVWAAAVCDSNQDAAQTYVVQNLRNGITAASFLATACSVLSVQGLLATQLTPSRVQRIEELTAGDPLSFGGGGFLGAAGKLIMMQVVILFSFLCFAQAVRVWVHLAYHVKALTSHYSQEGFFSRDEAVALNLRASLLFTAAFRSLFAFVPLLFWIYGPLGLLISTIVVVAFLYSSDTIAVFPAPHHDTTSHPLIQREGGPEGNGRVPVTGGRDGGSTDQQDGGHERDIEMGGGQALPGSVGGADRAAAAKRTQ